MHTVDFVIPHMGRPELLIATIDSILAQSAVESVSKIIVVTKNAEPLHLPLHEKLHILYPKQIHSISEQRNIGVAFGSADYIAFLDADIALAPDWLACCLALIQEQPGRVLVSAMQRAPAEAAAIERLRTALSNTALDQPVQFLPGRNLLVTREMNTKVGGFPEHLQTCEDYYYTEQLSQLGEVFYSSSTSYVHLGEDRSLKQTFEKEIWRSEYNLKSISGRKIPLREWPSILLPFWLLACSILLVLGVFWQPTLIAPALFALLLPILAYSTRLFMQPLHKVSFAFIVVFYSVYFSARTLGTLAGMRFLFNR